MIYLREARESGSFRVQRLSQLVSDSQSHGGPVIASSTPQVSLSYVDGSGNTQG